MITRRWRAVARRYRHNWGIWARGTRPGGLWAGSLMGLCVLALLRFEDVREIPLSFRLVSSLSSCLSRDGSLPFSWAKSTTSYRTLAQAVISFVSTTRRQMVVPSDPMIMVSQSYIPFLMRCSSNLASVRRAVPT